MKKEAKSAIDDDMRQEYDFSGAVRGSAYRPSMKNGYTIREERVDGTVAVTHVPPESTIILEPDVQAYFPDSESVNRALRTIITLFPKTHTKGRRMPETREGRRRTAESRREST